jgi:hypothetical protein
MGIEQDRLSILPWQQKKLAVFLTVRFEARIGENKRPSA